MKKILAILDSTNIYGKERANILVYDTLKKNGHTVFIYYNEKACDNLKKSIPSPSCPICFPRGLSSKRKVFKIIANTIQSNIILRKYIKKEKPSHILIPTEIALLYLYPTLFLSKISIVFRVGDDPICLRFAHHPLIFIYNFLWKTILNRVDIIVCNAQYIYDNIIKSGRKPNNRDKIIYNYIPERRNTNYDSNSANSLKNLNLGGVFTIGFIGRIVREKGLHLLIKCVQDLLCKGRSIQLFIAGSLDVDTAYTKELMALINEEYKPFIHFLGELQSVEDFYSDIDILCLPSIYPEPSANVVVEAKKYKKASILFNIGGTFELVSHLSDGYICEEISTTALENAILYYLDNSLKAMEHGQSAYNSIKDMGIDYSSFEKKWLSVFH